MSRCKNKDCDNAVFTWMDADYCCLRCRLIDGHDVSVSEWRNAILEEKIDQELIITFQRRVRGIYR